MDTLYLRTDLGHRELAERRHALTRWQRAVLIVIGQGKSFSELDHALRKIPEDLQQILETLTALGLVASPGSGMSPALPRETPVQDATKEIRRYLAYLIGIVENHDASAALGLTIALKKAATREAIENLYPIFLDALAKVSGEAEAERLLAKLADGERVPEQML